MTQPPNVDRQSRFRGLLVGTAVGDALGLPAEGLSARRVRKLFKGRWHHRFIFRRGMVSDDTEHTLFVAECLLAGPDSALAFRRALARKLRWWLLSLPASIGFATLRSIVKLWLGVSPERSGVYSAGNGPAMRSALIGAYFADSPELLRGYVEASTRLTHTDPRALTGALAIARLAAWIMRNQGASPLAVDEVFSLLRESGRADDGEWTDILSKMRNCYERGDSVEAFAAEMNLRRGVSGYVYHSVPVAVYSWMRQGHDFKRTLVAVLDCGGDTDTVAAMAGALAGASVGEQGIPRDWIDGVRDWPRGIGLLRRLGERLSRGQAGEAIAPAGYFFWPGLILRNLFFFFLVLLHVIRRWLPPY